MKDMIARIRGYLFTLLCRYINKNISIGNGLKMYCKLEIRGDGKVSIGKNCVISRVIGDTHQYVTIYTHDLGSVLQFAKTRFYFLLGYHRSLKFQ